MTYESALLNRNASRFELALSEAIDFLPLLADGIAGLSNIRESQSASVLPYLISENGLEEIEQFFNFRSEAYREGMLWLPLIGTPEAIKIGLRWVGYRADLLEEWIGRRRWNQFGLLFPEVPDTGPDTLTSIAKVVDLSSPFRSRFRRGVAGYNVPACETDETVLDGSTLDSESGEIIGGTYWSFGRMWVNDYLLTEADGLALGNWIDPIAGGSATWEGLPIPWLDANFPWSADGAASRRIILAQWFLERSAYIALRDIDGALLGYQAANYAKKVNPQVGGPYSHSDLKYAPSISGEFFLVSGRTGFGQFDGSQRVGSYALAVGGLRADGVKAGKTWLDPDELIGAVEIASTPVSIRLSPAVRERFQIFMRF